MGVRVTSLVVLSLMFVLSPGAAQDEGKEEEKKAEKPPVCSAEEHRQFDFWVGEWEVTADGKVAGTNKITSMLGGCVIMEEWVSSGAHAGMSFNRYDPTEEKWEQFWMDNQGGMLRLKGGYGNGKMILEGKSVVKGEDTLEMITWHNNDDGTVRQVWERSSDKGLSWDTVFDGLYKKKE